jgi:hypothetical protein
MNALRLHQEVAALRPVTSERRLRNNLA